MFDINEKEKACLDIWLNDHHKECAFSPERESERVSPKLGAIGGGLTYCFSPNGLGRTLVVRCACGGEIDVTDALEW